MPPFGWRRIPKPSTFDVALMAALWILATLEDLYFPLRFADTAATRDPDIFGYVLLLVAIVPLAWRRTNPIPVMLVNGIGFFGRMLVGYSMVTGVQNSALVAVYTVSVYASRPGATRWRALAVVIAVTLFSLSTWLERLPLFVNLIMFLAWLGIAFVGETMYVRRRYQDALEDRARRLEREQEEQAHRAVLDERARIARDLHDVWAHTVSLIVVQAGAAREVFDTRPDLARQALTTIQDAGRKALDEVRRMVAGDDSDAAPRTPAPGVGDLDALADDFRDSGLPVALTRSGDLADLAEDVSLIVYRIVQQALTNTLSHGGPGARATVHLIGDPASVTVRVIDDGLGADAPDSDHEGRGIIGMRERVAIVDGTLSAGPLPGRGFGIEARIPLGLHA